MRKLLIISDLSYLQPLNESSPVVGGYVYAVTVTGTSANSGSATAVAGAVAIGDNTYTNTVANTTVKNWGSAESTRADAQAIAYGNTGNQTAKSWSKSTSIYYNGS
ncbi:TonB-dependent receptor [Nostoc linckia FACHB-104]|nr:TonB-dependent receptor [Nostoc linckia FACHB-104]